MIQSSEMEAERWKWAHLDMLGIVAYCRARDTGVRRPVQEPLIALNPQTAYLYALKVIRGRFPMGEPHISFSPEWSVRYARFIMRGRFPMAESTIALSPEWQAQYQIHVLEASKLTSDPEADNAGI